MNINPVANASVSSTQNTFKANLPDSRINIVNDVDDYVHYMINRHNSAIENYAKLHDTVVKVAQRKGEGVNSLYINSGSITSRLDLNKMEYADFWRTIVNNIRANTEAKTKGLKKAFSRLA